MGNRLFFCSRILDHVQKLTPRIACLRTRRIAQCHRPNTLNFFARCFVRTQCVKKQKLRRKHDLIRPHLLKRNSSHVARTHEAHHGSKEQWEDEEEATRAASCKSASLQRVKESRWQHRQERKDAVSGQKDGEHQADKPRGQDRSTRRKKEEDSTVFRNVRGQKEMVP